jgi:ankyrin repeat protein
MDIMQHPSSLSIDEALSRAQQNYRTFINYYHSLNDFEQPEKFMSFEQQHKNVLLKKQREEDLHKAVENKDKTKLLDCINKKVNIDARCPIGNTALHIAAEKGYLKIALTLIKNKATINSTNYRGETPLHAITTSLLGDKKNEQSLSEDKKNKQLIEFIALLLANGALITIKDSYGNRPDNQLSIEIGGTPTNELDKNALIKNRDSYVDDRDSYVNGLNSQLFISTNPSVTIKISDLYENCLNNQLSIKIDEAPSNETNMDAFYIKKYRQLINQAHALMLYARLENFCLTKF